MWDGWAEREHDLAEGLTKIDFRARGTLHVVQGDTPRLRVRGYGPAMDAVSVDVSGVTLQIVEPGPRFVGLAFGAAGRREKGIREMAYYLELPHIEVFRHGGAGEMEVGPLTSDRLSVIVEDHADTKFSSINARQFVLNVRDDADINIDTLDADEVSLAASSSGDIFGHDVNALELALRADDHAQVWLAGRSGAARVNVGDRVALDASRLECDVADVRARDEALARLWVEESISVVSRDHSNVVWTGDPEVQKRGP